MRKLALAALLAVGTLTACTAPSAPAPYSPLGTWDVQVKPDSVTDWRQTGYFTWTTPEAGGGIEGPFYSPEGTPIGRAIGNVKSGNFGIQVGLVFVSATGTFSGNNYTGRYEAVSSSGTVKGDITMKRR